MAWHPVAVVQYKFTQTIYRTTQLTTRTTKLTTRTTQLTDIASFHLTVLEDVRPDAGLE